MSNDQLRRMLLRLDALQNVSEQIAADLKSLVHKTNPPFSPLTRSLLGMAFTSLEKSRSMSGLCQEAIRDALDADSRTPESTAVLLPFVCEFAGPVEQE